MKNFNLALQLYSVRCEMEKDFFGTLQKVKSFGYDGVEFAGLYGNSPKSVKEMCKTLELTPISAHVALNVMLENPDVFADYKEIGCEYIAIPFLEPHMRPGTDGFDEVLKSIASVAKKAHEAGLKMCYHNHDFEFVKVGDMYGLDIIYQTVPKELLKTELDVCWVKVGGADPSEYIEKYADRTEIVHLKDFVGSKSEKMYALLGDAESDDHADSSKFEFRPVGYGVQDIPKILSSAKKVGAKWMIVEQDQPDGDRNELSCAKLSADYLNSL